MNDVLRIACLKIALQRAFLGRAILRVIVEFGQILSIISISLIWSEMCSSGMPKMDLTCDGKRKVQGNFW